MNNTEQEFVKRLRFADYGYNLHGEAADMIERLAKENAELRSLVADFVRSEIDYMVKNNLGNPFAQHNVKRALKLGAVIDVWFHGDKTNERT